MCSPNVFSIECVLFCAYVNDTRRRRRKVAHAVNEEDSECERERKELEWES